MVSRVFAQWRPAKAAEWGESYAASSPARAIFLAELGSGLNRDFYAEVLERLKASNAFSAIRGRCGQDIGSAWYQNYMEREAFGDAANYFYDSVDYAPVIKRSIEELARTLENDLSSIAAGNAHMTYENRLRILNCASELGRLSVRVRGALESDLEKFRRLEDFDHKVIEINRTEGHPINVWLLWENGKNILKIQTDIFFTGNEHADNNIAGIRYKRKQIALDGFRQWAGSYSVFGGQKVEVETEIRETYSSYNTMWVSLQEDSDFLGSLPLGLSGTNTSMSWGGKGIYDWSPSSGKFILLRHKDADTAMHEFGHSLGLGDAYGCSVFGSGVDAREFSDLVASAKVGVYWALTAGFLQNPRYRHRDVRLTINALIFFILAVIFCCLLGGCLREPARRFKAACQRPPFDRLGS